MSTLGGVFLSVKLYFVRHGQSVANLLGCIHNAPEAPLTGLGHSQAAAAGHDLMCRLGSDKIDRAFSSPYRRALQTCHIALIGAGYSGLEPTIDERIGERRFDGLHGKILDYNIALQNGLEDDYLPPESHAKLWNYYSDYSEKVGVETLLALEARARAFFDEVKENCDGQTIAVFSHGGFGQIAQAIFNGFPEDGDFEKIKFLGNGEIVEFEY